MEKKSYGYVNAPEYPEGGKVKMRINLSFKPEQLAEMMKLVTPAGNVRATVVVQREGNPFLDVYDPSKPKYDGTKTQQTNSFRAKPAQQQDDLPF